MMRFLKNLASLRLTLLGLGLLIIVALFTHRSGGMALNWLALPLSVLSANLVAAILTNPTFRLQPALLSFHVGLFVVLLFVAAGLLTRLHGRIELVEGEVFDPAHVEIASRGPLHADRLGDVRVRQGPVRIEYVAGLQRGTTVSRVWQSSATEPEAEYAIDDRYGLAIGQYRLKPTFNKGYALLLEWRGADGSHELGAVNFPSFPEYEWQQRNEWTTPAGQIIELELLLPDRIPHASAWTLTSDDRRYAVSIRSGDAAIRLAEGEMLDVSGGALVVADLRLWIGYRIDANPFLPWILAAALFSVLSLGLYFHDKYRRVDVTSTAITTTGGQMA